MVPINAELFVNYVTKLATMPSASRHITSDLQNLSLYSDYGGNKDIMIGDGFEHGGILSARSE
ncbi:hypothetical protein AAG906_018887 [Vitis piasezkii]